MPFSSRHIVAIVGASFDPKKYGYKVFADLLAAGWNVIPINPKGGRLLGSTVFPSVLHVPQKIDGAVFITQPKVTEEVLRDIKNKGINDVWFQPGAESETAIKFCQDNDINFISQTCIMASKEKLR
ncbi:MAG: CoA-binding protein [Patescibacteria group bacterium]